MKKVYAIVMTAVMVLGLTGCGGGSKYSSKSKKIISAAESVFDAEEASKKQMKEFKKNGITESMESLEDCIFFQYDEDNIDDLSLSDNSEFKEGDVLKATFVLKNCDEGQLMVYTVEVAEEEIAEKFLKKATKGVSEKELKKQKKENDALTYALEKNDNEYIVIADYEDQGIVHAIVCQQNGKTLTAVSYSGYDDADMFDDFYEFMREAKLPDLQEMLEDAE